MSSDGRTMSDEELIAAAQQLTKDRVWAPWTDEQVAALERWQGSGQVHPFTCPTDRTHGSKRHSDRRILKPTVDGWVCEWNDCGYRQGWAHDFMFKMPALQRPGYRTTPALVVELAVAWNDDRHPILGAMADDTVVRFLRWQTEQDCYPMAGRMSAGPGFWIGTFDMADAPKVIGWLESEGLTRVEHPL